MIISYVDEAGDTGPLQSGETKVQPLFCILGLSVNETAVSTITNEFLALKLKYFPNRCGGTSRLNRLLVEVKGADIRRPFRIEDKKLQQHHFKFLDRIFAVLAAHDCRVFGRAWIKPTGGAFSGTPIYTASVQEICSCLHNLLETQLRRGIVIVDSRVKGANASVSHSVFTQRFAYNGNKYPRMIESPVFAHSQNHAMLQICDLICSGVVFPLAAVTYCDPNNIHVAPGYAALKSRYGARLRKLQHRYDRPDGNGGTFRTGGIAVSDSNGRSATQLFS